MTDAADIIQREHRSLMAVVHCLDHLVRETREGSVEPDFALFQAILEYIEDFPDRFHHPKEDRFLFARLAERDPASRPRIEALMEEHRDGERMKRDLEDRLTAWIVAPAARPQAEDFFSAALDYADFQRQHVRTEEQEILPAARVHLTDADWRAIDAAFNDNEDPMFGADQQQRFKKLLSRIASLAPEPIGYAPRRAPARPA